ncbi:MAG: hypothetical protein RR744_10415 [Cellulosilyticaceae bacterium]
MGKNKRKQIELEASFGKFSVDSQEEVSFLRWCDEALAKKFITLDTEFYQPCSWTLFTGYKVLDKGKWKTKLRPHIYSPDFKLATTDAFRERFPIAEQKYFWKVPAATWTYLDIKGRYGVSSTRSFPIDQKWVLDKFNVFVGKLIPEDLFADTWVPTDERYSPKKHILREKYKTFKTIDEV